MLLLGRLKTLPMPPTLNQSYVNVGKRRICSRGLNEFKAATLRWGLAHKAQLCRIRAKLEEFEGYKVRLEFLFKFEPGKLFTKQGKFKKLDVSNRIKAAEDSVSALLGFDDRNVFRIEAEKVEAQGLGAVGFEVSVYVY